MKTKRRRDEISPRLDIVPQSVFDQALFGFTSMFINYAVWIMFVLIASIMATMFLVKIDVGFDGTGEIRPVEMIPVRSYASGFVESIRVHDLQSVSAGDTLFVLDTENLRSNLHQLEAALVGINLQIDIRQHELLLTKVLLYREIELKKAEVEEIRIASEHARSMWEIENLNLILTERADPYDWKLAEARLAGSRIKLQLAESETLSLHTITLDIQKLRVEYDKILEACRLEAARIDHATVIAPIDGIVFAHDLHLKADEYVDAGTQLCDIGNPAHWMVRCMVSDRAVPFIRSGQIVHIFIDALPFMVHGVVRGYVTEISAVPFRTNTGNEFIIDSIITDERFQEGLYGDYNLNGLRATTKYIVEWRNIASYLWQTLRVRGRRHEIAKRMQAER